MTSNLDQDAPTLESEYEVEEFYDKGQHKNKIYYLTKWKGFDAAFNTWEPVENLKHCLGILNKFRKKFRKGGRRVKKITNVECNQHQRELRRRNRPNLIGSHSAPEASGPPRESDVVVSEELAIINDSSNQPSTEDLSWRLKMLQLQQGALIARIQLRRDSQHIVPSATTEKPTSEPHEEESNRQPEQNLIGEEVGTEMVYGSSVSSGSALRRDESASSSVINHGSYSALEYPHVMSVIQHSSPPSSSAFPVNGSRHVDVPFDTYEQANSRSPSPARGGGGNEGVALAVYGEQRAVAASPLHFHSVSNVISATSSQRSYQSSSKMLDAEPYSQHAGYLNSVASSSNHQASRKSPPVPVPAKSFPIMSEKDEENPPPPPTSPSRKLFYTDQQHDPSRCSPSVNFVGAPQSNHGLKTKIKTSNRNREDDRHRPYKRSGSPGQYWPKTNRPDYKLCYNCRKEGHLIKDCPERPIVNEQCAGGMERGWGRLSRNDKESRDRDGPSSFGGRDRDASSFSRGRDVSSTFGRDREGRSSYGRERYGPSSFNRDELQRSEGPSAGEQMKEREPPLRGRETDRQDDRNQRDKSHYSGGRSSERPCRGRGRSSEGEKTYDRRDYRNDDQNNWRPGYSGDSRPAPRDGDYPPPQRSTANPNEYRSQTGGRGNSGGGNEYRPLRPTGGADRRDGDRRDGDRLVAVVFW